MTGVPGADLLLDPLNPRINVPDGATQEEIRRQLLKHGEVVALAKEIKASQGLLPGERIIVWFNGTSHVVFEGNRRVAACQMLNNPTLVPAEYRQSFPLVDSEALVLATTRIKAQMSHRLVKLQRGL